MAICNYERMRGHEDVMVIWTDNPVADAEAYSAEGAAWMEAHAPVCEECGEKIYGSKCTVLEDACICNTCTDKLIKWISHKSGYLAGIVEDLLDEMTEDTPVKDTDNAWI